MNYATDEKFDEERLNDANATSFHLQHTRVHDDTLLHKDEDIREARNAAFAAAVATGGTDPLSKAAFVVYACKHYRPILETLVC